LHLFLSVEQNFLSTSCPNFLPMLSSVPRHDFTVSDARSFSWAVLTEYISQKSLGVIVPHPFFVYVGSYIREILPLSKFPQVLLLVLNYFNLTP